MAYRDARHERCGGGWGEAAALTLSPAAKAAAAAAAAAADGSPAVVYPALAAFDCAFEATSCVCAANIAARARDAADRASARTGSSSPSRARDHVQVDDDDGDDEATATATATAPLLDRRASVASRSTHGSFGASATALFACLSAAGYVVGTAGQAADGARLRRRAMLSVAGAPPRRRGSVGMDGDEGSETRGDGEGKPVDREVVVGVTRRGVLRPTCLVTTANNLKNLFYKDSHLSQRSSPQMVNRAA